MPERKYNLPVAFIAVVAIALLLLCVFSPAIASFVIAGSQDGFTLAAFDCGPSPWWWVGILALVAGVVAVLLFLLRVMMEGRNDLHTS